MNKGARVKRTTPRLCELSLIISKFIFRLFDFSLISVICSGSALSNPKLERMNRMLVDCSSAGVNVLFVAVLGPGGQEQVHVKHRGGKKYLVQFMMPEGGRYILYIKWGEQHVPGSPFLLEV